jgi:hypothetical protein
VGSGENQKTGRMQTVAVHEGCCRLIMRLRNPMLFPLLTFLSRTKLYISVIKIGIHRGDLPSQGLEEDNFDVWSRLQTQIVP